MKRGNDWGTFFFQCRYPVVLPQFVTKTYLLPHWVTLAPLLKIIQPCKCRSVAELFSFHWSIIPIPHCLNYCSFIVSLEMGSFIFVHYLYFPGKVTDLASMLQKLINYNLKFTFLQNLGLLNFLKVPVLLFSFNLWCSSKSCCNSFLVPSEVTLIDLSNSYINPRTARKNRAA